MSQPTGRCSFCSNTDLTKSHIWPEWAQKIIPTTSAQYEITRGLTKTFKPNAPGPEPRTLVKPGSVAQRRPRNTCKECNNGWMRDIEEAAKYEISKLMTGNPIVLSPLAQYRVATFLCLASIRIAVANRDSNPVPASDLHHLKTLRDVPPSWKIWLMAAIC